MELKEDARSHLKDVEAAVSIAAKYTMEDTAVLPAVMVVTATLDVGTAAAAAICSVNSVRKVEVKVVESKLVMLSAKNVMVDETLSFRTASRIVGKKVVGSTVG
eukprot:gene26129-32014_t